MLEGSAMLATIPVRDLDRARRWYEEKLGLSPEHDAPDALVYDGFLLFTSDDDAAPDRQVAAWRVADLEAVVAELRGRGVAFEDYDGELETVGGIATTPAGRAAWLRDSEGNVLTLMERA